ncbi:Cellulose synthase-like protein E6 [Morella rubra]|uniref:Cellulose synthase-like protein E6 n=1 Tax=Morella rubra TaxID=262757 RepID=A0A6A1WS00_9ROSI|nr:Cellulose synthase-like protein E6 [Morella rubra]
MAYDYPTEKLSVYLSDDGGSEITYYTLLEASDFAKHWLPYCKKFKDLYSEMENRLQNAANIGRIPEEVRLKHKQFSQWNSYSSRRDHDPILQIRVSSKISNGPIILNVDCDMYSNNSHSVRDALCFFMDEEKGHEVAFVQFSQEYDNITRNEVYSGSLRVLMEMGLLYGCPVEDVLTGLSIQCRGWKSVYFNPSKETLSLVLVPTSLSALVQHKDGLGDLQILFSKYSPAWYAYGKISLGLQMGYCAYCLWAPNCLATLFYSVIPSLYLLKGISLFPQVKGPSGDQVHDFRDKTSEKFEFAATKGLHRFCFTNKSPYHETIDFDIHISKLEEALYNIQFEQHWLEAQTERQAIVNDGMSRRAVHKAFFESAALIGASILQVYLLRRLFERKRKDVQSLDVAVR